MVDRSCWPVRERQAASPTRRASGPARSRRARRVLRHSASLRPPAPVVGIYAITSGAGALAVFDRYSNATTTQTTATTTTRTRTRVVHAPAGSGSRTATASSATTPAEGGSPPGLPSYAEVAQQARSLGEAAERVEPDRARVDWLVAQLRGIEAACGWLAGASTGYRELAERCHGVQVLEAAESHLDGAGGRCRAPVRDSN
jgi:hypothetical protein